MAGRKRIGRDAILAHAADIVARGGVPSLTYQKLATRLGVSKQAVIYWFPSKQDLARELSIPAARAEAEATIAALAGARGAADAIARFVRALVAHHTADLGRFRLMYLAAQFDEMPDELVDQERVMGPIHQESSRMYGALEAAIAADPDFAAGRNPRRLAAAVHAAGIGLLTMIALASALRDPLAHGNEALVEALVSMLAAGSGQST